MTASGLRTAEIDQALTALRVVVEHREDLVKARTQTVNRLHRLLTSMVRLDTPGRAYYRRKRTEGKNHKEALRCLKRRLSDTVYRHMQRDARETSGAGPEGHSGASLSSCAAG